MPTKTYGTFFVAKDRPSRAAARTEFAESGTFVLTLRVVDNQGPRRVESYVVRWTGADARIWWDSHRPLKAGDPLSLELVNPRSFLGVNAPEIHADITSCRMLPRRVAAMTASA